MSEKVEEFDGLYVGLFTPSELDLVIEVLGQYGGYLHKQVDSAKVDQARELWKAMNKLKEEGEV